MALMLLDTAAASRVVADILGARLDSQEGMADLVREEVSARGACLRSSLLRRVLVRLDGVVRLEPTLVERACDALVREGDLILAPGGEIAATPLRAVVAGAGSVRVFTSLPSARLARLLDTEVVLDGLRRSVAARPHLAERVRAAGGALLTPEQWAGLARAPRADAEFLADLTERLRWTATHTWAEDRHGPLDWQGLVFVDAEAMWRRPSATARLWRARHPIRRFVNAWTAGGSPSVAPCVELTGDEALRARFAEAAGLGVPARVRALRAESETLLEVPAWLPRAEYRWLSLVARAAGDAVGARRWAVAPADTAAVLLILRERLAVAVEEAS